MNYLFKIFKATTIKSNPVRFNVFGNRYDTELSNTEIEWIINSEMFMPICIDNRYVYFISIYSKDKQDCKCLTNNPDFQILSNTKSSNTKNTYTTWLNNIYRIAASDFEQLIEQGIYKETTTLHQQDQKMIIQLILNKLLQPVIRLTTYSIRLKSNNVISCSLINADYNQFKMYYHMIDEPSHLANHLYDIYKMKKHDDNGIITQRYQSVIKFAKLFVNTYSKNQYPQLLECIDTPYYLCAYCDSWWYINQHLLKIAFEIHEAMPYPLTLFSDVLYGSNSVVDVECISKQTYKYYSDLMNIYRKTFSGLFESNKPLEFDDLVNINKSICNVYNSTDHLRLESTSVITSISKIQLREQTKNKLSKIYNKFLKDIGVSKHTYLYKQKLIIKLYIDIISMQWFKEGNNRTAFLILNQLLNHYLGSQTEYIIITSFKNKAEWKQLLEDVMISRNSCMYSKKQRNATFGKLQRYIESIISRVNIVEFKY